MNVIKNLSDNELTEMISCLSDCISTVEQNYLHIAEYLPTELTVLKEKHSRLCDEYDRREEEDEN